MPTKKSSAKPSTKKSKPSSRKNTNSEYVELEKTAYELREDVINMLLEAGSGHSAGSLGTADIFSALYFNVLNIDPKEPKKVDRDRFVLSNGHIAPILYATLSKRGYFEKKHLWTLRKINSRLQGHPAYKSLPGIENTSGSLGQGFSQAIGMALSAKIDSDYSNQTAYRVFVMTGDGELQEGQIWEGAMFASNYNLNNLTWIIDRNNIQTDGYTEQVMALENLRQKLEAFNWFVLEIDGHNIEEIINACNLAKSITQRPTAIIAHTIPGKGVKFMEYKFEWHGKPPDKVQAQKALKDLHTLEGKIISDYV